MRYQKTDFSNVVSLTGNQSALIDVVDIPEVAMKDVIRHLGDHCFPLFPHDREGESGQWSEIALLN